MLAHLHACWGTVDFVNIDELITDVNTPGSVAEVPTIYVYCIERAVKQLAQDGAT